MLIGIDASRAARATRTGTENYSLFLIRALIEAGREYRFRLYFDQPPAEGLFPSGGHIAWRVIPFPRLWTHLRLMSEVMLHPPDVLYVPSHVLPLLHPRRSVATVHDLGYLYYPEAHTHLARWYLDWSTRFNARTAWRVIADSCATQRDLVRAYRVPEDRIVVAYPAGVEGMAPVTDATALRDVRERYQTGEQYFLYVGTLQPRKNLITLLEAFERFLQTHQPPASVRLVLAGKQGWLSEPTVERAISLIRQGRVVLPGYVPQEDLPALLSGALAFVMPSWYEGFGLPVLEAMACGTPVICSNASSLPEVAGEAALLFDPADAGALTQAMERLYTEPGLAEAVRTRGLAQARRFSWQTCARAVLSVLEDVAEGSPHDR
jgi:glycosyltransferase involved in cell wall biosynthesis